MGRCDVWRALVLGACACACAAAAAGDITVVQLHLSYDELHVLPLNNSVEYIVNFTMPAEARGEASVVWAHSDGGDDTHPVLITVRQRSGALTWQLPYALDGLQLFELERTLCPDAGGAAEDDCVDGASFSLHVSAWCARANLSLRARRAPAWALPLGQPVSAAAMLWSPRVLQFRFGAHEGDVRLVLSSEDSVCASVLVQNYSVSHYSCPIEQTVDSFSGLRMTMLLSGAVQLSREDYPVGFYVVAAVQATDAACGAGASTADSEWLWAAAMLGRDPATRSPPRRDKAFTIRVEPALSRGQYAVAAAVTLAVFGAFYAGVAALVLAQRWPAFARTVRPRAVLAAAPATDAVDGEARGQQASTSSPSRRRRGSDATYDSSDDSDSDEDYESARDTATTSTSNAANVLANTSDNNLAINSASRNLPPSQADDAGNTIHVVESNGAVDSSVVADSTTDGQPNGSANVNGTQTSPWGLPPQLRLAALARRRGRTLRARSDRYLYMLATVAVFYALPVVQFVIAFQIVMNVSGSLDICYYNFQCAHRLGALSDFNHVLSNLGYLLLGALFLLQVRRRRLRRKRQPRDEEYGIPAHYGLLSALGLCMMVVALLSACYHVCPNRLNFQFDTAFMYVLAVLTMVKIYQTRHPDVNARAHATFGVLAVLIAIVVWGVLGGGGVFWGMFTVLHIFTFLLLSLRIYYLGQFRLEKESLALAASEFRKSARPLYGTRLAMLLVGNAVNWCFAFYGLVTQSSDFASHLLQVLLANALVYMVFYLCMKLVHGERLRWYAGALLAAAAAAWVPALYYFLSGSSDWSAAPALSRHRNHECKVLQFYDNHDLWHILSAIALYLSFSAILTWDDGLSAVKRTDIPVF